MTEISKNDLAELLAILSEADTDLIRFFLKSFHIHAVSLQPGEETGGFGRGGEAVSREKGWGRFRQRLLSHLQADEHRGGSGEHSEEAGSERN